MTLFIAVYAQEELGPDDAHFLMAHHPALNSAGSIDVTVDFVLLKNDINTYQYMFRLLCDIETPDMPFILMFNKSRDDSDIDNYDTLAGEQSVVIEQFLASVIALAEPDDVTSHALQNGNFVYLLKNFNVANLSNTFANSARKHITSV